jgi:hypothetical protein
MKAVELFNSSNRHLYEFERSLPQDVTICLFHVSILCIFACFQSKIDLPLQQAVSKYVGQCCQMATITQYLPSADVAKTIISRNFQHRQPVQFRIARPRPFQTGFALSLDGSKQTLLCQV